MCVAAESEEIATTSVKASQPRLGLTSRVIVMTTTHVTTVGAES